jgi:hypothetical protein
MADPTPKKIIFAERQDNPLDSVVGANSTFFTGETDTLQPTLDPLVSGYAFIYWVALPSWFDKDPDLKYFKMLSQKNFKAFQNIADIDLQSTPHQTGFAGNEVDTVTGIQRNNTDFSLRHIEYSGGVMRKMYQKWISYIRDPQTGLALYPRMFNVEYGARNHTGQLLYVVTRPDATNTSSDIVEYAAFYSNVFPTNIPLSTLYNFDLGQQESPEIDIQFKGFPTISPAVEEYARKVMKENVIYNGENSGTGFIDSLNTDDTAKTLASTGTLKEIFNPDSN